MNDFIFQFLSFRNFPELFGIFNFFSQAKLVTGLINKRLCRFVGCTKLVVITQHTQPIIARAYRT